jgi:two-component system, LytTR family, response regulator
MTGVIRTVIADDEVLARRVLRVLLAEADDVAVVAECRDGREVIEALRALAPDLLFLDVQMPGLDGFAALAASAPARRPVTVFVTAHEHHALRAFDAEAVDYLLKPFDDDRFARALRRARDEVRRRRLVALAAELAPEAAPPPRGPPRPDASPRPQEPPRPQGPPRAPAAASHVGGRIAVKDGRGIELVEPDAIDWIAAEGYYSELHVGARGLLLREPMQDLEASLDPARFVRIHRSTIVNVSRVRRVERLPGGEYEVVLACGMRLRMSRGRRKALERLISR